jgi:hypothetical protein
MSLSVDTSVSGGDNGGPTVIGSGEIPPISTSGPNRVLVACIANTSAPVAQVSTITDTAGLTWTREAIIENTDPTTAIQVLELWWAPAPAQVTDDQLTVTLTTSTTTFSITICAVAGCPTIDAPWDSNVSLPATADNPSDTSGSDPSVSGVSTTNANTMVFFLQSTRQAGADLVAPSGFTDFGFENQEPSGGGNRTNIDMGFKIESSPLSGVTFTGSPSVAPWAAIVAAISGVGVPPPPRRSFGTMVC